MNRTLAGIALSALAITLIGTFTGCAGTSGTITPPIPDSYIATDITPGAVGGIVPNAINDSGVVVGTYRASANADQQGFMWSAATGFIPLGTLGGATSQAFGVSPSGVAVGVAQDQNGIFRAVRFDGAVAMPLVAFSNNATSSARAINAAGSIVGSAVDLSGLQRPVKFPEGGSGFPFNLGSFGGDEGVATGINTGGSATGYATNISGERRAFLAGNGNFADLTPMGSVSAEGLGINDSGDVVGRTTTTQGRTRAFLYQLGSSLTLNEFPAETESVAFAINTQRIAVGSAMVGGQSIGIVWFGRQTPVNLNTKTVMPGNYVITEARGIDAQGRIVVVAEDDLGRVKAFVLTPDTN